MFKIKISVSKPIVVGFSRGVFFFFFLPLTLGCAGTQKSFSLTVCVLLWAFLCKGTLYLLEISSLKYLK